MTQKNKLICGDCLPVMQDMPPASVDLIYADPPFCSNRDYGDFGDKWRLDESVKLPEIMREMSLDKTLRRTNPALLAYLVYITERLLPMKGLLKPTGSIYLHCDPTASHYIKVMMDAIFGHKSFRNEIIWAYRTGGVSKRWFGRKHDTILFYVAGKSHTFHVQKERSYSTSKNSPPGFKEIPKFQDEDGRWYTMPVMRDVWNDINSIYRNDRQKLGYPTQKPIALLERIIKASTNENDTVFDPFCGSATTIEAAHRLKRKWIGCDIASHAIDQVARARLADRLGLFEGADYDLVMKSGAGAGAS